MDDGEEQIDDEGILQKVRSQAQKVQRESLLFTGVLEILILLIP